jgi:hypothetical protein
VWVISSAGNLVNLDQVQTLLIVQNGATWHVDAADVDGTNIARLVGDWSTKADAAAAARRLVDGVDLATYA